MSTPTMKEALAERAGELVRDLFLQHFDGFGEELAKSESNKLSVSVGYKLRQTGGGIHLSAKISYGAKTTDEAECEVSDPKQEKLKL
jgi:hypothetical protein